MFQISLNFFQFSYEKTRSVLEKIYRCNEPNKEGIPCKTTLPQLFEQLLIIIYRNKTYTSLILMNFEFTAHICCKFKTTGNCSLSFYVKTLHLQFHVYCHLRCEYFRCCYHLNNVIIRKYRTETHLHFQQHKNIKKKYYCHLINFANTPLQIAALLFFSVFFLPMFWWKVRFKNSINIIFSKQTFLICLLWKNGMTVIFIQLLKFRKLFHIPFILLAFVSENIS